MMRMFLWLAVPVLGMGAAVSSAWAGPWDVNISRLCSVAAANSTTASLLDCGGGYDPQKYGTLIKVYPHNGAFRSLMSELGVVFAPNLMAPADTQGFGGTNLSLEFGWTKINPKRTANGFTVAEPTDKSNPMRSLNGQPVPGLPFWRAASSVSGTAFSGGDISSSSSEAQAAQDRIAGELPANFAPTMTLMARKGLWLPAPSFELGVGIRHLIGSRMWAPTAIAKLALHEGFQGWPLPALAVRGSGARVLGSRDFNLTVAGLDFSMSKHIGVASTFNLTPYAGYQILWIIADSEVLDATPSVDSMAETIKAVNNDPLKFNQCAVPDCNANFSFANQSDIIRHRLFLGMRANFFLASLLLEYSFFASGNTTDNLNLLVANKGVMGGDNSPADNSGSQHSISFSLEVDF